MLSIHQSELVAWDSGWIAARAEIRASEDAVLVRAILSPIFQWILASFVQFLGSCGRAPTSFPGIVMVIGSWRGEVSVGRGESMNLGTCGPLSMGCSRRAKCFPSSPDCIKACIMSRNSVGDNSHMPATTSSRFVECVALSHRRERNAFLSRLPPPAHWRISHDCKITHNC